MTDEHSGIAVIRYIDFNDALKVFFFTYFYKKNEFKKIELIKAVEQKHNATLLGKPIQVIADGEGRLAEQQFENWVCLKKKKMKFKF